MPKFVRLQSGYVYDLDRIVRIEKMLMGGWKLTMAGGGSTVIDEQKYNELCSALRLATSTPLTSVPIPSEVYTKLRVSGIDSVAQLQSMTKKEVMALPGIGALACLQIVEALAKLGMKLKEEK